MELSDHSEGPMKGKKVRYRFTANQSHVSARRDLWAPNFRPVLVHRAGRTLNQSYYGQNRSCPVVTRDADGALVELIGLSVASHVNLRFLLAPNLYAVGALGLSGRAELPEVPAAKLSYLRLLFWVTLLQWLSEASLLGSFGLARSSSNQFSRHDPCARSPPSPYLVFSGPNGQVSGL